MKTRGPRLIEAVI